MKLELELTKDEVTAALLEWVEQKWPKQFNAVDLRSYGTAIFTFEKPEEPTK